MKLRNTLITGLAALAVTGTLARPAQAEEPSLSLDLAAATRPYGAFADVNGVEDGFAILTYKEDGMTIKAYQQWNTSGTFNDDKNVSRVELLKSFGTWSVQGAVTDAHDSHQDASDTDALSASVLAIKTFGNPQDGVKLGLLAVFGEENFNNTIYWRGKHFDSSFGNSMGYDGQDPEQSCTAGIHDAAGTLGLWVGRSRDGNYVANVSVDKPGLAAYVFSKSRPDGSGFISSQYLLGDHDGGGLFSKRTGQFTAWILADQFPRPLFRSLGSHLANAVDTDAISAQLVYNDGSGNDDEYLEGRVGRCWSNWCADVGATTNGSQTRPTIGGYTTQTFDAGWFGADSMTMSVNVTASQEFDGSYDAMASINARVRW